VTIKINEEALEKVCKEIIETILICLPNAFKGTVYQIGNPPDMIARRITSGIIDEGRKEISWGLPEKSDYNSPGKRWREYRDEPGRPLEAMAWCVERQESWTAEDPKNDSRSVRLQVEGAWADFHHMEPVLIRKRDLYPDGGVLLDYPKNHEGRILWEDSEFVVVAVIKIHFRPHTIKIGGPETKVIQRLSRALGTELLSHQLTQKSLEAMNNLAEDRLNSCNILADSLRNVITKSGLIFSLIKLELDFLRGQWEDLLLKGSDERALRRKAVAALNMFARSLGESADGLGDNLIKLQQRFMELHPPPEQGENWLRMQVEEKWNTLIQMGLMEEERIGAVQGEIHNLKRSLYLGSDPHIVAAYEGFPEPLKTEWVNLLYSNGETLDLVFLDRLIHILESPYLDFPYREKSKKSLIRLKAVAQIMGQLEDNTNVVLRELLNGHDDETIAVKPLLSKEKTTGRKGNMARLRACSSVG